MSKKDNSDVEFKIRVPKALMGKINDFRHGQKLDSKKQAVVYILESFFSPESPPQIQSEGKGKDSTVDAPLADGVAHANAAVGEPARTEAPEAASA